MRARVRGVPAPTEPQVGDTLGRYKVMEPLDDGTLGARYKVRHVVEGTYHTLRLPPAASEAVRAALLTEGRVQRLVSEPGLVRYTDAFEQDGRVALVSDWLDATSLAALLEDGALDTAEALAVFEGALAVVGAAHACGLSHEALGPESVLLVDGAAGLEVRIADFGLRRAQLEGASAFAPDVAADVRALGGLLQRLIADGDVPRADVPRHVCAALARAMAQGFPDIGSFAAAMQEAPSAPPAAAPLAGSTPPIGTQAPHGHAIPTSPLLRAGATLLAVLAIVLMGGYAHSWPLRAARADAREVDTRVAADLELELAAAARLRAQGLDTIQLMHAVTSATAAASPELRLAASERLCDALRGAVQRADAPAQDAAALREIERMIAAARTRNAHFREVLARRTDAEASLLTPFADVLGE